MVCWIGRPIGTVAPTWLGSVMTWHVVKVVFSVGPYPLTSGRPRRAASTARTVSALSTSPPARTTGTAAIASMLASAIWWNSTAGSQATVTPAERSSDAMSGSPSGPGGAITTVAPVSSAPQISNVEASKPAGARCSSRSPGPRDANVGSLTSRMTARCGIPAPFGAPVEPEVKLTYAKLSGCETSGGATLRSRPGEARCRRGPFPRLPAGARRRRSRP